MTSITATPSSFDSPLIFDRFLRDIETKEGNHTRKSSRATGGKMKIPFDPRIKPTSEGKGLEFVNRTILLSKPVDSVAFKAIFNEFAKIFNVIERQIGNARCIGIYANDFRPEIKVEVKGEEANKKKDELLNLVTDPTVLKRLSPLAQPSTPPSRPRGKSSVTQVQKVALTKLPADRIQGHSPVDADAAKEFVWSLRNTQELTPEKREILKEIYSKFDVDSEKAEYIPALEAYVPNKGYMLTLSNSNEIGIEELNDKLNPYSEIKDQLNRMIFVDSDEVLKWADLQLGRTKQALGHARSYSSGSVPFTLSPARTSILSQPNSPSSSKSPLSFPRLGSISMSSPTTPTVRPSFSQSSSPSYPMSPGISPSRPSLIATSSSEESHAEDPISRLAEVTRVISNGTASRRGAFVHSLTISTERMSSTSQTLIETSPLNEVSPQVLTRPSSTSITSPGVKKGPPPLPASHVARFSVATPSDSSLIVTRAASASVTIPAGTNPTSPPMPKRPPPPLPNKGAGHTPETV